MAFLFYFKLAVSKYCHWSKLTYIDVHNITSEWNGTHEWALQQFQCHQGGQQTVTTSVGGRVVSSKHGGSWWPVWEWWSWTDDGARGERSSVRRVVAARRRRWIGEHELAHVRTPSHPVVVPPAACCDSPTQPAYDADEPPDRRSCMWTLFSRHLLLLLLLLVVQAAATSDPSQNDNDEMKCL